MSISPAIWQRASRSNRLTNATREITVSTRGKGLYECTAQAERFVQENGIATGLMTAFIRHTSASLVIQENADPDVVADLNDYFGRLVKESDTWYRHRDEGPDDMTSHIRSALTQTSLSIPIHQSRLCFGTWQGLFVFEHRAAPHSRKVMLHAIGE